MQMHIMCWFGATYWPDSRCVQISSHYSQWPRLSWPYLVTAIPVIDGRNFAALTTGVDEPILNCNYKNFVVEIWELEVKLVS